MLHSTIIFSCDYPGCKNISRHAQFVSIEAARQAGWAISRDRIHCYCPRCAPKRRNVGCKGGFADWRDLRDSRSR